MKEIKAYVRVTRIQHVVESLERAGFCCMTIIDVSGLGSLADAKESKYSFEFVERYSKLARIELVCRDENAEEVIQIIKGMGCTHQHGDGIIFVLPVEQAVKIRNGEEGDHILQTPHQKK